MARGWFWADSLLSPQLAAFEPLRSYRIGYSATPMAPSSRSRTFELDLTRYQLRMDGRPLHLERQAMELLILLARRRDQLVVRDDIAAELWPAGVHIDIDQSINRLIRKVRLALRDDPDAPRFIETVVGKGYRFVGPLSVVNGGPAAAPDDEHMTSAVPAVEGPPARLEHVTAPQATTTGSTGVASPRVYRVAGSGGCGAHRWRRSSPRSYGLVQARPRA